VGQIYLAAKFVLFFERFFILSLKIMKSTMLITDNIPRADRTIGHIGTWVS